MSAFASIQNSLQPISFFILEPFSFLKAKFRIIIGDVNKNMRVRKSGEDRKENQIILLLEMKKAGQIALSG